MQNKIESVVGEISFKRRRPVSRDQKNAFDELRRGIDDIRKDLNRLHLLLWYASWHKDYGSLFCVRECAGEIAKRLDALSKH